MVPTNCRCYRILINYKRYNMNKKKPSLVTSSKKFSKILRFDSTDTNVKKYVFEVGTDAIVEAVLYRYPTYTERTVICCSIQSGCKVGCKFCGTGKFFKRNLTTAEIVEQIKFIMKDEVQLKSEEIKKFQIMFMSMGEPMHNIKALVGSIRRLHKLYPTAQLLVSTSAPVETYNGISEFIKVSREIDKVGLQFSIHESTDENRHKLIPTETLTLRQIASIGELWFYATGRQPFFNYCVHAGNSSKEDAERLADIFDPRIWQSTLSVICSKSESVSGAVNKQLKLIETFNKTLLSKGFSTRVFNPAGQDDIGGGCGQLWYFQQWRKEHKEGCK